MNYTLILHTDTGRQLLICGQAVECPSLLYAVQAVHEPIVTMCLTDARRLSGPSAEVPSRWSTVRGLYLNTQRGRLGPGLTEKH